VRPPREELREPLVDLPLRRPDEQPLFLRPRQRPRKLRRSRLARTVLFLQVTAAIVALMSGIWVGYGRVMASDRLKVTHVEVRGGSALSPDAVQELLGPALGENILNLDLDALKARVQRSPWVADATVTRTLPDTLRVEVRERVPLALAEVEGQSLQLMDADGALIEPYGPRTASYDLPIVRGLRAEAVAERRTRAHAAGALLDDLGDLAASVSEVEPLDSGDLRVVLRDGQELLMSSPPFRERFLTFLALREELAGKCPGAQTYDLRFASRIYARPCPDPRAKEGR
jgi:cell division protein FtsQ